MTKAEIKALAANETCMEILNSISDLLKEKKDSDKELISQLIDDVYKKIQFSEKETKILTKAKMLEVIKEKNPELYKKFDSKTRLLAIRMEYNRLTNQS